MVDSYEDHGILSWFDIAENYLRLIGIKTVLQVFEQLLRDKSKDVTGNGSSFSNRSSWNEEKEIEILWNKDVCVKLKDKKQIRDWQSTSDLGHMLCYFNCLIKLCQIIIYKLTFVLKIWPGESKQLALDSWFLSVSSVTLMRIIFKTWKRA